MPGFIIKQFASSNYLDEANLFFATSSSVHPCPFIMRLNQLDIGHATIERVRQMKYLVDERYPQADKIGVIQDQLNTHAKASLYKAFEPEEAKRILDKLEFHYTPKHGSWLNMAEIEFSVLNRQCLNRRIPDQDTLKLEIAAWSEQRNQKSHSVNWRFTTADARINRTYTTGTERSLSSSTFVFPEGISVIGLSMN
jgi:transposase